MCFRKILLIALLISIPSLSISVFGHGRYNFGSGYNQGWNRIQGWVGYEQQMGALNNKFITYGGASTGFSFMGISLGAGVYGNYGHNVSLSVAEPVGATIIYGGVILGLKSPRFRFVRLRLNTLLGYGTIALGTQKTGYFVVSPTFYLDFRVISSLNISLGVTYRYFHNADNVISINNDDNSFAGIISFSWIDG